MEILLIVAIILVSLILISLYFIINKKKFTTGKLEEGSSFDHYKIITFIKRGGMALIYKAVDIKTNEIVALKIMQDNLLDDEDLVNKFLSEGDTLEKLNRKYPNAPIVRVYRHSRENNSDNGRPFIALEYVEGHDLEYLLEHKMLTEENIHKIIYQTAEALSFAHREGIWHRDISPGNIIVELANGEIINQKIIDFGVAKHEYSVKHTPDGSIHGKPPFMSPEQCRNEKIDGRSDIYSLGILYYTLLNGSPPFTSKNPLQVMEMHQSTPIPLLKVNIPNEVTEIIYRMLEKSVNTRFQSIDDLIDRFNSTDNIFILQKEVEDDSFKDDEENEEFEETGTFDIGQVIPPTPVKNNQIGKPIYILASLLLILIVAFIFIITASISNDDQITVKFSKGTNISEVLDYLKDTEVRLRIHFVNNNSGLLNKTVLSNNIDKIVYKNELLDIYVDY